MENKQSIIDEYLQSLEPLRHSMAAEDIIQYLDYTSLNDADSVESIAAFCQVASQHPIAAVCLFPQFVAQADKQLAGRACEIATVANFPQANTPIAETLALIDQAINDGATEIDVVMPYQEYIAGNRDVVIDYIRRCKRACGEHIAMKVILETGALPDNQLLADVCSDIIDAGADFLKTSTGKLKPGATPEAAIIMMLAIRSAKRQGREVGFKASGGVRTYSDALTYINLAEAILGRNWITPKTFRIGASQLLQNLLAED